MGKIRDTATRVGQVALSAAGGAVTGATTGNWTHHHKIVKTGVKLLTDQFGTQYPVDTLKVVGKAAEAAATQTGMWSGLAAGAAVGLGHVLSKQFSSKSPSRPVPTPAPPLVPPVSPRNRR
jgi:hypothetical protein